MRNEVRYVIGAAIGALLAVMLGVLSFNVDGDTESFPPMFSTYCDFARSQWEGGCVPSGTGIMLMVILGAGMGALVVAALQRRKPTPDAGAGDSGAQSKDQCWPMSRVWARIPVLCAALVLVAASCGGGGTPDPYSDLGPAIYPDTPQSDTTERVEPPSTWVDEEGTVWTADTVPEGSYSGATVTYVTVEVGPEPQPQPQPEPRPEPEPEAEPDDESLSSITVNPAMEGGGVITAGTYFSCVISENQRASCWGSAPSFGKIVDPQPTYIAISAGRDYACAITTSLGIKCIFLTRGELLQLRPLYQPEGAFTTIAAGPGHACAIRTDRTLACWGYDIGGRADAPSGTFSAVTAGAWHSCGLRTDGTVECWGDSSGGRADAPSGTFSAVSAGWAHSCAIRTDGTVECWGDSSDGRADAPSGTFSAVSAGEAHSCAIRTDGTVECWGHNLYGQADAPSGTFSTVIAGPWHSCGRKTNGHLDCWGWNSSGQIALRSWCQSTDTRRCSTE